MVKITASVFALLAAVSFTTAAPASLFARGICRDDLSETWERGNTAEAAQCISELAALGDQPCVGEVSAVQFKKCGSTVIMGQSTLPPSEATTATATCQDVARGAGIIMDMCSRGDGTVMGQNPAWGNGNLMISVLGG